MQHTKEKNKEKLKKLLTNSKSYDKMNELLLKIKK